MHNYGKQVLYQGEREELLHGWDSKRKTMPWFTKEKVVQTIRNWDFSSFNIMVSKILWDEDKPWGMADALDCEKIAFDMYRLKDLDDLVGYLFQASIEGYSIRYVSTDMLTGIYLEWTRDGTTNIDDEVLETLVKRVDEVVPMRG